MGSVRRCSMSMDEISHLHVSAGGTNNVKDGNSLGETTGDTACGTLARA